jgi:hypothetical protein
MVESDGPQIIVMRHMRRTCWMMTKNTDTHSEYGTAMVDTQTHLRVTLYVRGVFLRAESTVCAVSGNVD